jgi:uncharacterized protein (DUF111 family)
MKRGRPGFTFHALCGQASLDAVVESLLVHTTSIGVRYAPVERRVLERTEYDIGTELGTVRAKESVLPDGTKRVKPEYRDMAAIAQEKGISVEKVRRAVEKALVERKG